MDFVDAVISAGILISTEKRAVSWGMDVMKEQALVLNSPRAFAENVSGMLFFIKMLNSTYSVEMHMSSKADVGMDGV